MAGILDFILNFPGHIRCKFIDVMRNILKIVVSAAWAVILPIFYISSQTKVNLPLKNLDQWFGYVKGVPQLYILAVAVYLIPNMISATLFLFPMFRRWIENSDWHIVRLLLWWSQVFNSIYFIYLCSIMWKITYAAYPRCKYSFQNFCYEAIFNKVIFDKMELYFVE